MQPKEIKLKTKINHNRRGKTNGLGSNWSINNKCIKRNCLYTVSHVETTIYTRVQWLFNCPNKTLKNWCL